MVDCLIEGKTLRFAAPPVEGGGPVQVVRDSSSFALVYENCGPLHISRYTNDGREIWAVDHRSHSHSFGVLASGRGRLYVFVFEPHPPLRSKGKHHSAVFEYDWASGALRRMYAVAASIRPSAMAVDDGAIYLIRDESPSSRRATRYRLVED